MAWQLGRSLALPIFHLMNEGVSVVLPAYNYADFIREALASALSQTWPNLEVIVVDDGSTDQTRRIVHRFSDPRIRYVYQANRGLSAARNTGISLARFAYIAFLDADDVWLPGILESAMRDFSTLPTEFGLVASGSLRITGEGLPIDRVPSGGGTNSKVMEIMACDIVIKSRFMPSSVVVRSAVFKAVGDFDTHLRSSEDRDMWIRIAEQYRIQYRSEPMVLIRKHGHNMSKNADRMRLNMRIVLSKYFRKTGVFSIQKLKTFCQAYSFNRFEVAWMYYDESRFLEAAVSVAGSLLLWPCFFQSRKRLNQPIFFRPRALARFLLAAIGFNRF